jgi:hypothetical protein
VSVVVRLPVPEPLVVLGIAHALVQHFEGTHAATNVVGMNEGSTRWIALGEKGMKRLIAPLGSDALVTPTPFVTDLAGGKVHLVNYGIKVETGATTENGNKTFVKQAVNAPTRIRLEALNRIVIVYVCYVNHKKRNTPLGNRSLCRAHIHPAVDLHGINRDN